MPPPPNNPQTPYPFSSESPCLGKQFNLSDGKLTVKQVTLLPEVPSNVTLTDFSTICESSDAPLPLYERVLSLSHNGGFLGFHVEHPSDWIVNSLGKFTNRNFLSIFRFKTWWSTQWVGNSGSDLPMESQWVLLDLPEIGAYAFLVPIIEGSFRSALYPGDNGHVMIGVQSGSTQVKSSSFRAIAYVHVSQNPYNLMKEAYSAIRVHLSSFRLLEEKCTPSLADKFGWCTWDAFYLTVDPIGVWHGVNDFHKGGLSLRFLIIDDGWQSINLDGNDPCQDSRNLVLGGEQMSARLHRLDEGYKFREYKRGSILRSICKISLDEKLQQELDELLIRREDEQQTTNDHTGCEAEENYGMKAFTADLRAHFKGLDDIYVWQALCGAWGGVRPETTHLNSKLMQCKVLQGQESLMEDEGLIGILGAGIGLVNPEQASEFYDSMHSCLRSAGITGVKVDVIHSQQSTDTVTSQRDMGLTALCVWFSSQLTALVTLAKTYYEGLSKSLEKNFNGTNLISSMQQCNDFFFLGTKQISMGRAGDDFWYEDPNGDPDGVFWLQGVHMIHCAYNSLWVGQIIHPDWDMFQSDHLCAEFHAGSRAICGGPVYVSDCLGCHDFDLLKKLVYPDGTIPKCQHFGLPTRDILFKNPLSDQKTILKIWNLNKYGGVIGAFNCQGARWDPKKRRIQGCKECYKAIEGSVHANDMEWDQKFEPNELGNAEEYAVYLNQADSLLLMTPKSEPIHVVLNPSSFELFSFVPVKKLAKRVRFAPIGLRNMYNSGGTIMELEYEGSGDVGLTRARMKIKGGGSFLAYSDELPNKCIVNGRDVGFEWLDGFNLLFGVPWVEEFGGVSERIINSSFKNAQGWRTPVSSLPLFLSFRRHYRAERPLAFNQDNRMAAGKVAHATLKGPSVVKEICIGFALGLSAGLVWKMHHWNEQRKVRAFYDMLEKGEISVVVEE
ncbi:hypothetical protein Ancab_022499 [Ancistrocladus abbreviatus]